MSDDFWDVEETVKSMGGISGAIAASMAKWARKAADLYPTPPDCVYSLAPHVEDILPRGSLILEPCCANGQVSLALQALGYETDDYDLRPDPGFGIGGVDFLDRENGMFGNRDYDAVWTNPPFVVADKFILRSLELAPIAIMLLKAQYFHTANRRKLFRELKPYAEIKLTWRPAFLEKERGKSPLMDCSWFIFRRGWTGPCVTYPIDRIMDAPMSEESMGGL